VLLVAVVIAMAFYKDLISLATLPHYRAMCWVGSGARFILLGFGSVGAVMKLSAIVGFFFASPYIARQLWGFVSEGLYRHERRHVAAFAPVSFLLFVLGIGEYLGFVLTLTIVLGLIFQLPMVMVFLTKVGLVPSRSYRDWRKHAIVANIALAAVLSPPDLMSMAVFALPLLILYELGVWCALWAESRQ
jgi:sec-independent protein translocase protein TatC